jgi:predicted transposase YdaD
MELIEEEAERRGLEKGIEKGKIEGKIEGAEEKERSIVIGAHKKNIAPQQISDVTGISLEKVLDIIKKHADK